MSTEGFTEIPVETFGGVCQNLDPADVPIGMSLDNQDVEFFPGGVQSRAGLLARYSGLGQGGSSPVTGLKLFMNLALKRVLLMFDYSGNLYSAIIDGAKTLISTTLGQSRFSAVTAFGRVWMGFSRVAAGSDRPLVYDGANLDRATMWGPGDAPAVIEPVSATLTIDTSGNSGATRSGGISTLKFIPVVVDSIGNSGAKRTANVATIKTTSAHGLAVGNLVNVNVTSDASFSGFGLTVISVPDATHFTYANAGPDVGNGIAGGGGVIPFVQIGASILVTGVNDASFLGRFAVLTHPLFNTVTFLNAGPDVGAGLAGGGTAAINITGSIAAGIHQVAVFWITRTGYRSKYSPATSFLASGSSKARVTIPVGPANVVARGVAFTASGGARFYHVPASMYVNNNTDTTVDVDFTEVQVTSGEPVDSLGRMDVLPYAAKPISYASRLLWIGEENWVEGLNNFGFEGGVRLANGCPQGWTPGPSFPGGAVVEYAPGFCAWQITGAGGSATGEIRQGIFQDAWFGVQLLEPGHGYTLRFRARKLSGTTTTKKLKVDLYGAHYVGGTAFVLENQIVAEWAEFEVTLLGPNDVIDPDLTLGISLEAASDSVIQIDELRMLPADEPYAGSRFRGSFASEGEAFDTSTCFGLVSESDGQTLRDAFEIRDNLFLVKEGSIHVTRDDGITEPNDWSIDIVSEAHGCPSNSAIVVGDGWALVPNKNGLWFVAGLGATFINVAREIQGKDQTTGQGRGWWDQINWSAGHIITAKLDKNRARVLYSVPMGGSTVNSHTLVLDFGDITGPYGALLTDPVENGGRGRKWTRWNLALDSMELVENDSEPGGEVGGVPRLFLGNAGSTGKVYEQFTGVHTDDGAPIAAYYDTAYLGGVGFGNRLFGYMVAAVEGLGTLKRWFRTQGQAIVTKLSDRTLTSPAVRDTEATMNIKGNRASFRFSVANPGDWFRLVKLKVYAREDLWGGGR